MHIYLFFSIYLAYIGQETSFWYFAHFKHCWLWSESERDPHYNDYFGGQYSEMAITRADM